MAITSRRAALRKISSRRGIYFTVDAMFAAFLIISALALLLALPPREQETRPLELAAQDSIAILTTLKLADLPDATLKAAVLATNQTNENESLLRVIGVLWATNSTLAPNVTAAAFSGLSLPISYAVYAEGDYLGGGGAVAQSEAYRVYSARQSISGIAQGKPLAGSTATGLLRKIENRSTATFLTFGGFVGQGNITSTIELPSDLITSSVIDLLLELDTPSIIVLRINGNACGTYTPVNPGNSSIDAWLIKNCSSLLVAGNNTINLNLLSSLDQAYISGGFLRVRYTTDEPSVLPYASPSVTLLPGITGIVNLYDAVYAPGNISSMSVRLHYATNRTNSTLSNTFYLTIGNTTVYRDNTTNSTVFVNLTDVNLSSILNYSKLSGTTIPVRLGFENLTFTTVYSGSSDVMLATDVSGSMGWRMDADNVNGVVRSCTSASINNSDTQRLSVAKCLDQQFVSDILNVSGNRIGLVSYATSTDVPATKVLSTNLTLLNSSIAAYNATTNTCICCGINSAVAELSRNVTRTVIVASGTSWNYLFGNGSLLVPANDTSGKPWYAVTYLNASSWVSGSAPLGALDNGSGPAIVKDMGNTFTQNQSVPVLWERTADLVSPEVDFTSGLNSTGNTFGLAGTNDGWDWQGGTYGYAANVNNLGVVSGALVIDANTSPSNRNNCANNDCSGAYGVTINITASLYNTINRSGSARVAFYYQWNPASGNPFESSDEVWVKARWTAPGNIITNLGTEQSSQGSDATTEIDFRTNPDVYMNGTYTQDITSLITGPGLYYLDIGGKLQANVNDEWGRWRFDNVLVAASNQTDVYYLRKNFTISNYSLIQQGILNVMSDDRATVYINGNLLLDEGLAHTAQQWNIRGYIIPQGMFTTGTNVIAVRIENNRGQAKFDLELLGLNTSRSLAMLAMTDGVANQECAVQNTGSALEDAILSACMAREDWGITVHTVGFSTSADAATLQSAAACGSGLYTASANTSALADFYRNVVINILDSTLRSQSVVVTGSFQPSTLFPDSSITIVHNGTPAALLANEVGITTQSGALGSCTPTVIVPPSTRVLGARVTSYSADHWTDFVSANGVTAFDLGAYQTPYIALGDPYIVQLARGSIVPGANTLNLRTGDSPTNSTGCSVNNTLITDLAIPINPTYTPVLERAIGCFWTVEQDSGGTQSISVPRNYVGAKTCSYTNASISYDALDAYDVATANLLSALDYDSDGRIFISLADEDVEIIVNTVSNVPYLWGPSLIEVRVWQ